MNIIDEFKSKIKNNPNNYIIIKKYNYKIFKQYEFSLFNYLHEEIIKNKDNIIDSYFNNFALIDEIVLGDAAAG